MAGTPRSRPPDPIDRRAAELAAVARALAVARGVDLEGAGLRLLRAAPADAHPPVTIPDGAGPAHLARVFEGGLGHGARRRGAHHTPPDVAAGFTRLVVDGDRPPTVCDPCVGGGAFLLAAADHLVAAGSTPTEAVGALWGMDVDPLAVAVSEAVLALWLGGPPEAGERIVVGDFLLDGTAAWRGAAPPAGGFDLVVGNPPFQAQLASATARDRDTARRLRDRFGPAAAGYVDTAALFLLAGLEVAAADGRVGLLAPRSVLVARDAAPTRREVLERARLRALWRPEGRVFEADVDVVGLALQTRRRRGRDEVDAVDVHRALDGGPVDRVALDPDDDTWSVLAVDPATVPTVHLVGGEGAPTVGSLAATTAGFRQHFYAIAPVVAEAGGTVPDGRRRVLTSGAIDPAHDRWGSRPSRIGGRTWDRPVVDPADVHDAAVVAWVSARCRPKVVVATQTRVLEAVADPVGDALPLTPVIAVEPAGDDPEDLWRLLAVLLAPPVAAWVVGRRAGSGRNAGAVRPTARLLADVPLPRDADAWAEGARLARAVQEAPPDARPAGLRDLGRAMTAAYGAPSAVSDWWWERLPRR